MRLGSSVLSAQILNNGRNGLSIKRNSSSEIGPGIIIQGNSGKGILADDGSLIDCKDSTITGNTAGDVDLSFGSRSTLNGNTIGTVPISTEPLTKVTPRAQP